MPSNRAATSRFPHFYLLSQLVITTKGFMRLITLCQQRYIVLPFIPKAKRGHTLRPKSVQQGQHSHQVLFVSTGKAWIPVPFLHGDTSVTSYSWWRQLHNHLFLSAICWDHRRFSCKVPWHSISQCPCDHQKSRRRLWWKGNESNTRKSWLTRALLC